MMKKIKIIGIVLLILSIAFGSYLYIKKQYKKWGNRIWSHQNKNNVLTNWIFKIIFCCVRHILNLGILKNMSYICAYSSDGQSSCLLSSRSDVRIILRTPIRFKKVVWNDYLFVLNEWIKLYNNINI